MICATNGTVSWVTGNLDASTRMWERRVPRHMAHPLSLVFQLADGGTNQPGSPRAIDRRPERRT